MKLISSNKIGIQSGTFTMFSDIDKAGEMWDVHSETNFRMKLQAIDITESGFTACFETWDDTRIARMHVTWQAIGEAIDPDEIWDV